MWEYLVYTVDQSKFHLQDELDRLGELNWELINANSNRLIYEMIFKRKKDELVKKNI